MDQTPLYVLRLPHVVLPGTIIRLAIPELSTWQSLAGTPETETPIGLVFGSRNKLLPVGCHCHVVFSQTNLAKAALTKTILAKTGDRFRVAGIHNLVNGELSIAAETLNDQPYDFPADTGDELVAALRGLAKRSRTRIDIDQIRSIPVAQSLYLLLSTNLFNDQDRSLAIIQTDPAERLNLVRSRLRERAGRQNATTYLFK